MYRLEQNAEGSQSFPAEMVDDVQFPEPAPVSSPGEQAKGRLLDNIFIGRLWRTLKYECVYLHVWEAGSVIQPPFHRTPKRLVLVTGQRLAQTWCRLKGAKRLPLVIEGVTFTGAVAANGTENRAA